jgi:hypothetical protein
LTELRRAIILKAMGKPPWLFYYIGNYKNFFVGPILGIFFFGGHG